MVFPSLRRFELGASVEISTSAPLTVTLSHSVANLAPSKFRFDMSAENINPQQFQGQEEIDMSESDSFEGDLGDNYGFERDRRMLEDEQKHREERERRGEEEKGNEAEKERLLSEISALFRTNPHLQLRSTIEELEKLRGKTIEEVKNVHSNAINDVIEEKGMPAAEFSITAISTPFEYSIAPGIQAHLLTDDDLMRDIDLWVRTKMGQFSLTTSIIFRLANNIVNYCKGIDGVVDRDRKRRRLERELETYGIDPGILNHKDPEYATQAREAR